VRPPDASLKLFKLDAMTPPFAFKRVTFAELNIAS
jgi:hypothetical protein